MFTLYWIAFVPPTRKATRPSMSSNGSRTSNISYRSGWPRGLGKLNPKPHSWIFSSVSVDSSPRSHLFTSATVRRILVHTAQRARCGIEPISDAPPSRTARRGAAHLRSVIEIKPKPPFSRVKRSPIRYCFRASAKAIRYNVNIASVIRDKQTNRKNLLKSVYSLTVSLKLHLKIFYTVG